MLLIAIAALASGGVAFTATLADERTPVPQTAPGEAPKICKMVVNAEANAKPYSQCMTKAEWAARQLAEAKDPNRLICHYEEQPGTRFRTNKRCMTADEWDKQRLEDRQAIEKIQMQTCVPGGGC
jgi:hypothetical protein